MKKVLLASMVCAGVTFAGLFFGTLYHDLGIHAVIALVLGGGSVGVALALIDSVAGRLMGGR